MGVLLASCSQGSSVPVFSKSDNQEAEIKLLSQEVDTLQKQLLELTAKVTAHSWANLQVNERGYSTVDAAGIPLTFALKDVVQSASGSKVTLTIGNPTSAAITRLYLNLTYGKATKDGLLTAPTLDKVEAIETRLSPGQWTDVQIGLPNMLPRDLGIVRVNGAVVENMSLRINNAEQTPTG
jgi:hypothetical protein